MSATKITSPSANAGFTVIEVLMAILIMTVGLLGLLQSVQVAYQHTARNRLRDEAALVAEEQMNQFRLITFDNITAKEVPLSLTRDVAGGTRTFQIVKDCQPLGTVGDRCLPGQGDSKKLSVAVSCEFQNVPLQHVIYTIKNR